MNGEWSTPTKKLPVLVLLLAQRSSSRGRAPRGTEPVPRPGKIEPSMRSVSRTHQRRHAHPTVLATITAPTPSSPLHSTPPSRCDHELFVSLVFHLRLTISLTPLLHLYARDWPVFLRHSENGSWPYRHAFNHAPINRRRGTRRIRGSGMARYLSVSLLPWLLHTTLVISTTILQLLRATR